MRKILTLCLAGTLLTGCESDFDKCMRTELPRATVSLGLENARQTLLKLDAALTKNEISLSANSLFETWLEANPRPGESPKAPEYDPPKLDGDIANDAEKLLEYIDQHQDKYEEYETALEAFLQLPEVIAWGQLRDTAVLTAYKTAGVPIEALEELDKWENFDGTNKLLMPRAIRNGCWGEDECDDPLAHEWNYLFQQDNYNSKTGYLYSPWTIKTALTKSIEWQEEELARLEKLAPETAIRACNANGFYE